MLARSLGYQGLAARLPSLLDELARDGCTVLLDVRLHPTSRYPGYRKAAIQAACEAAGLRYVHAKALGNPWFKAGRARADNYDAYFLQHADELEPELMRLVEGEQPVIMCGCAAHDACHRRVFTAVLEEAGWQVRRVGAEGL